MLKRTIGFLITIALIHSLAYVPQTYAASATIVISHIQAGVTGAATKEFVALYNNSNEAIDISYWCLTNKSHILFACFFPEEGIEGEEHIWLPGYSYAAVASIGYVETLPVGIATDIFYTPSNFSSGSIVGSSDTVSLVDPTERLVDSHSWTINPNGNVIQRKPTQTIPVLYANTDTTDDWIATVIGADGKPIPSDQTERRVVLPEKVCPDQEIETGQHAAKDSSACETDPVIVSPLLRITEVLPNPSGADAGREYVELYNKGSEPVDLFECELRYGSNGEKTVKLPRIIIQPQGYTVIGNDAVLFTLPNTAGIVYLVSPDGVILDSTTPYENPKDDQAWVLLDGIWKFSKFLTPGEANNEPLIETVTAATMNTPLKACAQNQYRHPETNRCRSIAVNTVQTACKPDQYRNIETGRCRTVSVASKPAACKIGQERNPETNRCRNVKALAVTDYGVLKAKVESKPDQWYMYASVGVVGAALLGYAIWEWRTEIRSGLRKLRSVLLRQ